MISSEATITKAVTLSPTQETQIKTKLILHALVLWNALQSLAAQKWSNSVHVRQAEVKHVLEAGLGVLSLFHK